MLSQSPNDSNDALQAAVEAFATRRGYTMRNGKAVAWLGFPIESLRKAFAKIAPKPDWRGPIRAVVSRSESPLVAAAIEYHCGAPAPRVESVRCPTGESTEVILTHPGYYRREKTS